MLGEARFEAAYEAIFFRIADCRAGWSHFKRERGTGKQHVAEAERRDWIGGERGSKAGRREGDRERRKGGQASDLR